MELFGHTCVEKFKLLNKPLRQRLATNHECSLLKAKKTLWPFTGCSCTNQGTQPLNMFRLCCPADRQKQTFSLTHFFFFFFPSVCLFSLLRVLSRQPNSQMCSSSKHHSRIPSRAHGKGGRQKVNAAVIAGPNACDFCLSSYIPSDCLIMLIKRTARQLWKSRVVLWGQKQRCIKGFNAESLQNPCHCPPKISPCC